MIQVRGLDHFVLRVRDLDKSLAYYRDVLGLPVLFFDEYRAGTRPFVSVRAGAQLIDLVPDPTFDPDAGARSGGYLHCCLEVEAPLEAVIALLREHDVKLVDDEPAVRMGANGLGRSIYTYDPDGYIVELKEGGAAVATEANA